MTGLRKVVVTGASGYIGGRLVAEFLRAGWEVHAVTRRPTPRLGVPETVCDLSEAAAGAEAGQALDEACAGAETVVHLAGEKETLDARAPAAALASTLLAGERVSEACQRSRIRRLIYMSTVHVYGARMVPGAVLDEEMRAEPRSAYAIARLACEHVMAGQAGAPERIILRLTNSVGAPTDPSVDRWSLVANDLCRQVALEGRMALRSSGTQWRDFVAVADVCRAIVRASSAGGPVSPGTYNLGTGRPSTVRALAELVQDAFAELSGERPVLEAPAPEPDPPAPYHVSVRRSVAQGLVGETPLHEAVAETAAFCLAHRDELSERYGAGSLR